MAGLELWWLGQAGFRLRDPAGGPTIFCDPFITPSDRRTWQAPITPEALAQADLVLVSHEHTDHLDRPALKAAAASPGSRFTLIVRGHSSPNSPASSACRPSASSVP